jgi:hypothetical protein
MQMEVPVCLEPLVWWSHGYPIKMKIFVLLVAVIYIMGLLRAMLSQERVREYVRGKPIHSLGTRTSSASLMS